MPHKTNTSPQFRSHNKMNKYYITPKQCFIFLVLTIPAISFGQGRRAHPLLEESKIELQSETPLPGVYNNADGSPVFKLLGSAKKSIDIEIYEMADADFKAQLRSALANNIKVRIIKEPNPLGDNCEMFQGTVEKDSPDCVDSKKLKDEIITKGGAYIPFNKKELCADSNKPCFLHGKMILVDDETALISSGNFNSSNLCNLHLNPDKCNRDYTMIVNEPETLKALKQIFEADLLAKHYDLKQILDSTQAKHLTVSPLSLEPIVSLINSAKKSIYLENQYLKENTMNKALADAAKKGVHVEITLASVCSFGPPSAKESEQLKTLFSDFDTATISTKMLPAKFQIDGKPGYLHAKAMVIDETTAWVGSVNGSISATSNNREFGFIFTDPNWVKKLQDILQSDHQHQDMETWQESLQCLKDSTSHPNSKTKTP